jgi:hypothetical protein
MAHGTTPFVSTLPPHSGHTPLKSDLVPLNLVKSRHTGDFQRLDDLRPRFGCALRGPLSFEHGKTLTFFVPRAHIEAYSALYTEGVINLDLLFLLVE